MSTTTAAPPAPTPPRLGTALELAGWLALCLGVGAIGGLVTAPAVRSWYPTLVKPPWTPPSWLFAPVWTTLYVLMAVAAWRVGRRRSAADVRRPLLLFLVQLALNAAWSPLFFGARQIGPALGLIGLLWAALALTIARFRRVDRPAAWLLARTCSGSLMRRR